MSLNARKRVNICRDLISLCDILSIDISFKKNSLISILDNNTFANLEFISSDMVKSKSLINSPLKSDDNRLISDFMFSLGKSDSASQKLLINSFRESMELSRRKYEAVYAKNSRLYLAFGVFSGLTLSLIVI